PPASAPEAAAAAPEAMQAAEQNDANAQAARAANRATAQVPGQSGAASRFAPSAQMAPNAPTPGGLPPGAAPAIQPQFQFHRPPPPPAQGGANQPVGPQGADALPNQPLTAPASGAQGTGG
ncbi:outer membrane protein assembly factor BamE, partial [Burkholderia pseudomallei]|nr:outer membrane protein assembly factor BamE [Burkholderia pseudomallei]MEB5510328.1 outer membrane protein assembly factor BamE [Burkholderia pseudomallei]